MGRVSKSVSISRSMLAPLGTRPEVGVLMVTLEPLAPLAFSPPTTRLPWPSAYTSPSAARSGVSSSVPPRRLLASPSDETVMSMVWPLR